MIHWLVCPADACPGLEDGAAPPGFLSTPERETYAGLAYPKRRREWLLGRWTAKRLLRLSLARYGELSLRAITVGNDPDGAPFLSVDREGRLPVSLSISHRQDRAFCALSPSPAPPIGADIERVEPRDPVFVHDFFTTGEAQLVQHCPPAARDTLVTVMWSAKESVLKTLRLGLRADTRRVEIQDVGGIEPASPESDGEGGWRQVQVQSTLPGATHLCAWWRRDGTYVLTLAAGSSQR
ncbi:MAG: 4'-phosphopantetheinyl transferase superfamily protein [Anaerolineae bacterium]|nr:4'-phosphopantetheinyl transferase superfamily protein [Anaerolineae bacterium]